MPRSTGQIRFRVPVVIPAVVGLLFTGVIAVIASSGAQASIPAPQGTALLCNNPLTPDRGQLVLDPASGPPGSMFDANLSDLANHPNGPWPVVVLWDWSGKPNEDIIGQGESPQGTNSASVPAMVPTDAATGEHRVTACWQEFGDNWYRLERTFLVTEATSTPTATPTPTPTPTPSPTPTPTPSPTAPPPTPTPFKLIAYLPILDFPIFLLPTEDLSIHGIEVTQGIQCFDTSKGLASCPNNSLPVVAKKNTTARIYLKYSGPASGKAGVPVRLHLFANGVEYLADTWGKATPSINQANADSANVWFNVNFSNDINVSFYAEVDPGHIIAETNETNNRFPASGTFALNFRRRGTVDIAGWRTRYHPSGYTGTQYAEGWAVNGGGADWLEYLWPVRSGSGIDYSVVSGYLNWTTALSGGTSDQNAAGQHSLISNLNLNWIMQNYMAWIFGTGALTGQEHVYGWVDAQGYGGGHADMPVYPHAGGLGVVAIGTDNPGTSVDNPASGAVIFGHELTHDYNMYHTDTGSDDCGSNDSNSDFPYTTSSIQEFGFNPDTGKIYDPAQTHDLMSYCPPGSKLGWISPFTWNKMFNNLSGSANAPFGLVQGSELGEALAVNATIDNPDIDGDQGGSLGELFHHDAGAATVLPPAGEYAIELRNGSQVLLSQPFSVSFESEYSAHPDDPPGDPSPLAEADASFIMGWDDATTSIALVHGAETLDEVAISANAPVVNITDPAAPESWGAGTTQTVAWTGSDADGDTLSYSVYYSHDGAEWHILDAGISGTSYEADVDSLAGGDAAHFRVVATDGVNIGQDESAAVTVPNKPPFPTISSPENGAVVTPGGLVVFNGSGLDLEDGSLPDDALTWSSDLDGDLGTGSSLAINTLSEGLHTITLTAEDSDGTKAFATVQVLVAVPAQVDVQPDTISPAGEPPEVTVTVILPPGYPTDEIDQDSLRLHIGAEEFQPQSVQVLGDTDDDGLIEMKLTFDGAGIQDALPSGVLSIGATLSGELGDGTLIQGSDVIGLTLAGDADCDGAVDSVDALQVLRFVAGLGQPECLAAADVDCSGAVNSVDSLHILRFVADLPQTGLPADCPGIAPAVITLNTASNDSRRLPGAAWLGALLAVPAVVAVRRRRLR